MNRRLFISTILAGSAFFIATKGFGMGFFGSDKTHTDKKFPFSLPEEEWKARLDDEAYYVLRKHGTERARTSPLNDIKEPGIFHCKGCDHPLFETKTKYESGTGWPSFYAPINDKAVGTKEDNTLFMTRTEVHCANCGGHLGHMFPDGPPPTGLRYCMNGAAMVFKGR